MSCIADFFYVQIEKMHNMFKIIFTEIHPNSPQKGPFLGQKRRFLNIYVI